MLKKGFLAIKMWYIGEFKIQELNIRGLEVAYENNIG